MDPEKLLNEINKGKGISEEVLKEVIELLEGDSLDSLSPDDVYSYVSILGVADAKNCMHVLDKFLDYKDPLTVVKVLGILCESWDCTEDYLERVIAFALGVSWDEEEDLRQAALGILGEYLYKTTSIDVEQKKNLIELLDSVFSDKDVDIFSRIAAYRALCRSAKWNWEKIPAECLIIDVEVGSKDIDWKMLESLKK